MPTFEQVQPFKVYEALLLQTAPTTQTSGTLLIGAIYTLTTFNAGDNFSNMELLSGTVNTTGSTFRAIVDTPTDYSHSSVLDYDGAPYVVSINSDGDFAPSINTIGDIVWSYDGTGNFIGTLAGAFPAGKVYIYIGSEATFNNFQMSTVTGESAGNGNEIYLAAEVWTSDLVTGHITGTGNDDLFSAIPISILIKVYS